MLRRRRLCVAALAVLARGATVAPREPDAVVDAAVARAADACGRASDGADVCCAAAAAASALPASDALCAALEQARHANCTLAVDPCAGNRCDGGDPCLPSGIEAPRLLRPSRLRQDFATPFEIITMATPQKLSKTLSVGRARRGVAATASTEYPRCGRGVAATRLHGNIFVSPSSVARAAASPRLPLRNIHAAAATSPRLVSQSIFVF